LLERLGANQVLKIKGNFIPDMLSAVGYAYPYNLITNINYIYIKIPQPYRDHGVCNSIKQLLEQFLISIRNQTIGKEGDKSSAEQLEHCYSFWIDTLVSLVVGSSDVISEYLLWRHWLILFIYFVICDYSPPYVRLLTPSRA
jgi:hypothetical protein